MGNDATIELDVSKSEYSYVLEPKERWQKTAEVRLVGALYHIGEQAKKYRYYRQQHTMKRVFAAHDAIFLSAERGGGKTAFLHNIEKIWDEAIQKNDKEAPKICFCNPIDPTLLVNEDNFANVVIAQLYNEVESQAPDSQKKGSRELFFKKLQALADSLAQTEEQREDLPGIDRIVGYRCGIQLEQAFHDYVAECVSLLSVDAIAIRIDDVDMALRKGFDVLDVVRRLLSCPLIIPIVSGDEALFRPIVRNHFIKGGTTQQGDLLGRDQAEDLTDSYLTKIFPNQYRVSLVGLESLLHRMVIRNSEKDSELTTMDEYFIKFNEIFCPFVNGQEGSYDRPKPANPRQLVQMVRTFPPKEIASQLPQDGWYKYQVLAESYHHGTAYVVSETEQQLLNLHEGQEIVMRLNELMAFSVSKQVERELFWKSYDYYQSELAHFANASSPNWRKNQRVLFDWLEGQKIFRTMPPTEFLFNTLQVSKEKVLTELVDTESGEEGTSRLKLLASIYLHHTYYGSAGKTGTPLFFGRAFELVTGSLLLAKSTRDEDVARELWKDYLVDLISTPPFHSIYSLAPTKMTDDDSPLEQKTATDFDSVPADNVLNTFVNQMIKWENEYGVMISECRQRGLIHLFSCVMNKVFTQLHVMKERDIFKDDALKHAITRFEIVYINAIATFLNSKRVVLEDVARTPTNTSLENQIELFNKTSALRVNVKDFLGVRDGHKINLTHKKEPLSLEQKLLKAIWLHPLFTYDSKTLDATFIQPNKGKATGKSVRTTPVLKVGGQRRLNALKGTSKESVKKMSYAERVELFEKVMKEMEEKNIALGNLANAQIERVKVLGNKER